MPGALSLSAQIGVVGGSIFSWAIVVVAIGGCIALVILGINALGYEVPAIVIKAAKILGITLFIIFAIVLLAWLVSRLVGGL